MKKKTLGLIAVSLATVCTTAAVGIAVAQDYSANDPLISQSYLEQVFFKKVTDYIDTKVAQIPQTPASETAPVKSEYEIVTLTKGQSLCSTSSLEFILRPGSSATVISPIPENGIANLTSGSELYNGTEIPINAYCLIPRGDGRGVYCTSETAYIMVRGSYEIK